MRAIREQILPYVALVLFVSAIVACSQSDAGITTAVKGKLAVDSQVHSSEINVDTKDGVVTLTGNIDSQQAKDRALKLARETKGVRDVQDMISVRQASGEGSAPSPDRSLGERIDDAGITMKVKAKLLDDPMVKGLKIDVDTRDGVVYLTGSVSGEAEKQKAIDLARSIEGVRDVQSNLL
jgi:hyperosmotically inducible periplasmic protein